MNNLKVLNDIRLGCSFCEDGAEVIKKEAIKWCLFLKKVVSLPEMSMDIFEPIQADIYNCGNPLEQLKWIKMFFNISEEEIK